MMASLETGPCLWIVTSKNIFGFPVENLEHLGTNEARDWNSILLPPPFDFHLNLPEQDLFPFLFDSKLFFAGGTTNASIKIHQLSYPGGTTLDIADAVAAGTIPEPPTLQYDCFVATIQGHVYLLVHDMKGEERETGFWILRSNQWERLSSPPPLLNFDPDAGLDDEEFFIDDSEEDIANYKASISRDRRIDFCYRPWQSFVWKHKLFLMTESYPRERHVIGEDNFIYYAYDTGENSWKQIQSPFSWYVNEYHLEIVAVPSLGDVCNCNVALTWSTTNSGLVFEIHALLVDNEDNCVRRHCICKLYRDIPSHDMRVNFVDLGEGKVCVLIGGYSEDCRQGNNRGWSSILHVLVLKLSLVREERQRFLSVDEELVNQVYDMGPYTWIDLPEGPRSSFLLSMPLNHPYSQ